MTDNNQENFRPQSPLSLYSYVNPAPVVCQPIVNRPPSAVVAREEVQVIAAKSILKKPGTAIGKQPVKVSRDLTS
jgi:hypothetical protein